VSIDYIISSPSADLRPFRSNKAVAHGAVFFFINHYVHMRVSRATYGIKCNIDFNKREPEHVKRSRGIYLDVDGKWTIPGSFCTVLEKVNPNLDCNL